MANGLGGRASLSFALHSRLAFRYKPGAQCGRTMKYCQQCNLDFSEAFKYCPSCGGPTTNARATVQLAHCPSCGEALDAKWSFCTKCGRGLQSSTAATQQSEATPTDETTVTATPPSVVSSRSVSSDSRSTATNAPVSAYESLPLQTQEMKLEATRQHTPAMGQPVAPSKASPTSREPPTLTMLQSYGERATPMGGRWWHGTLVVLILFLGIVAFGIGGWYWWSHRSAAQSALNQNPANEVSSTETPNSAASTTLAPVSKQTNATHSADEELRKLRERRLSATPANRDQIVVALEDAEKKLPGDYRFPYERAKLSIKGIVSHHEAFGALFLAAQRAIDNGKSDEMLNSLMADKDGDFYKISRGHGEWKQLEEALKSKDKSKLSVKIQH